MCGYTFVTRRAQFASQCECLISKAAKYKMRVDSIWSKQFHAKDFLDLDSYQERGVGVV